MIIRTKVPGIDILSMDFTTQWVKGNRRDFLATQYVQHVDPIKAKVQAIKAEGNNGFTADRTMQCIGIIPMVDWVKHPEFIRDPKSVEKWLKTEEGSDYKIAKGI